MSSASPTRARLQATLACAVTLTLWWWRRGTTPAAFAGIAAAFALLAWVAPARYAPLQHFLDRIVQLVLGGLTWVLLALVYFLVFTPLRLLRGALGRDPLARRPDPAAASYLRPLPPGPSRFDRQF
jgi:hypothetical protein